MDLKRPWLALLIAICALSPLVAKNKDKDKDNEKEGQTEESSELDTIEQSGRAWLSLDLAWADVDTTSGLTDWDLANGGPNLELGGKGAVLFSLGRVPSLSMGPFFSFEAKIGTKTVEASGDNPYLVANALDGEALSGLRLDYDHRLGALGLYTETRLLGGALLVFYDGADSDYLPVGSDPSAFWSRIMPGLGLDSQLKLEFPMGLDLEVGGGFFQRWNAETAYGYEWSPGFLASGQCKLSYERRLPEKIKWKTSLGCKADWDSGIIIPVSKYKADLSSGFDFGKSAAIDIAPLSYSFKQEASDFDPSQAETTEQWLGMVLRFASDLGQGRAILEFSLPYWASDAGGLEVEELKTWGIGLTWEMR